jgi:hypothetical protein
MTIGERCTSEAVMVGRKLSSSYELAWGEDSKGRSLSRLSRIREGVYELSAREDGPKGWRLELKGTGHRQQNPSPQSASVEVHRRMHSASRLLGF